MGMEHTYDWRLSVPAETLRCRSTRRTAASGSFDATLALQRREWSSRELRRALVRYPLLTLRLSARIYTHALAPAPARSRLAPAPGSGRAREHRHDASSSDSEPPRRAPTVLDRLARRVVLALFARIRRGELIVNERSQRMQLRRARPAARAVG